VQELANVANLHTSIRSNRFLVNQLASVSIKLHAFFLVIENLVVFASYQKDVDFVCIASSVMAVIALRKWNPNF
jgi:hypothetical protein